MSRYKVKISIEVVSDTPTEQRITAALVAIAALKQNNEHKKWFEDKNIDFEMAA